MDQGRCSLSLGETERPLNVYRSRLNVHPFRTCFDSYFSGSYVMLIIQNFYPSLKPRDDLSAVIHPTVHCWTPTNDLYIGCEEGLILMFNGESSQVTKLNIIEESLKSKKLPCFFSQEV